MIETNADVLIKELEKYVYIRYNNVTHGFLVVEGRIGDRVTDMVNNVFKWFYNQSIFKKVTIIDCNDHEVTFEKKY
jgi:hypothetical protein